MKPSRHIGLAFAIGACAIVTIVPVFALKQLLDKREEKEKER